MYFVLNFFNAFATLSYVDHQISMNPSSRFSYECLMDVLQTVLTFHP